MYIYVCVNAYLRLCRRKKSIHFFISPSIVYILFLRGVKNEFTVRHEEEIIIKEIFSYNRNFVDDMNETLMLT